MSVEPEKIDRKARRARNKRLRREAERAAVDHMVRRAALELPEPRATAFAMSLLYNALGGEPPSAQREKLRASCTFRRWCRTRPHPLAELTPTEKYSLEAYSVDVLRRAGASDEMLVQAKLGVRRLCLGAAEWLRRANAPRLAAKTGSEGGSSRGGRAPKRRTAIADAICQYLIAHPSGSNREVWDSFPKGYLNAMTVGSSFRYSVFRDGDKLYQVDSEVKNDKLLSIAGRVFDRYMTDARKKLRIPRG